MKRALALAVLTLAVSCTSPPSGGDGGPPDSGGSDSGLADAGSPDGSADSGNLVPPNNVASVYSNDAGSLVYEGYVPPSYDGGLDVPLVVALHGCTQTAAEFSRGTRFNALAAARTFIVVYPQQDPARNIGRCWNWYQAQDSRRDRGEASLVAGITRLAQATWRINKSQTFVTGISAGGAMTVQMAAAYPDLYAAIAVHAGCEFDGLPCGAFGGPAPAGPGARRGG